MKMLRFLCVSPQRRMFPSSESHARHESHENFQVFLTTSNFSSFLHFILLELSKMLKLILLVALMSSCAMASLVIRPRPSGVTRPTTQYIRFADMIVCDAVIAEWNQVGDCSFVDYCDTFNAIQIWEPSSNCKIYTNSSDFTVSSMEVHSSIVSHYTETSDSTCVKYFTAAAKDTRTYGGHVCGPYEYCHYTSRACLNTWCINQC